MKKKLIVLFLLLATATSMAFSYQVLFQNVKDVFVGDLEEEHLMPAIGAEWGETGGYNDENQLGFFGVTGHAHPFVFSVTCSCEFTSASTGSSKPCTLAFCQRLSDTQSPSTSILGSHYSFLKSIELDSNDPTETISGTQLLSYDTMDTPGTMSFYTPTTDNSKTYSYDGASSSTIGTYWVDIVLVMDGAIAADGLQTADDYVMTITIDYHCLEPGCSEQGSKTVVLSSRAYYNTTEPTNSYAAFLVTSTGTDFDIEAARGAGQAQLVGNYSFSGVYGDTSASKVKIFPSSSASAVDTGADYFFLKNDSVLTAATAYNSVPITIVSRDTTTGNQATYDGTDYYSTRSRGSGGDSRLYTNGGTYRTLAFPAAAVGNSGNTIFQTVDIYAYVPAIDPRYNTATLTARTGLMAGDYTGVIYYHIVVEE